VSGLCHYARTLFKKRCDLARYKKILAVLVFVAIMLAFAELSGIRGHMTGPSLHAALIENERTGILLFIVLFVIGNLMHVPGLVFLGAAVLAFGPAWGGIATYAAAIISCAMTFIIVRYIGGDALRRFRGKLAVRILSHLDSSPVASVALLRVLFQTMPSINYALALSGVSFSRYMAGTLLGLPLPILAYCLLLDKVLPLIPKNIW
jgi:uncharacterized membrane protein YdjX (TVP38/TMEM64 family)